MNATSAIYARVSTEEQSKGYSLKTQVDNCIQYAALRGYDVIDTFADDYTGASLDRPALNKLRVLLDKQHIDVVVVYDIDRIARKSVYQMLIEEEFKKYGTRVEYVNGQFEDTDEGRLQKQIRASIAEYEKAKILERSKRGKRGKAQSGYVIVGSRPPYGYRVVSEPHRAWFEVDEEEAEIVKLVFHWYLHGSEPGKPMSVFGIQSKLTELGIPTRGDKMKHVAKKRQYGVWTDKMVRNILSNETYCGVWHYGKTKMVSDGKEFTRKAKPKCGFGKQVACSRDEWTPVEVPVIISRTDFDAAQVRLQLNKEQAIRNVKRDFLLGRRLRCSVCGYTVVGMTRRERNRYYRCNGAWRKPKVCDMPNFRVDQVDAAIWEWIKGIVEHPERISKGLRSIKDETAQSNKALYERAAIIETQLSDAQTQLGKLLDLFLTGDFPKEMLQERKTRLEQMVANLQREKIDIESHLQTSTISDEQVDEIEAFCKDIRSRLEAATYQQMRQLVDFLDVRGTLAIEDGEKVVYVKCQFLKQEQQRVSVARTSHSSNIGATATRGCACPSTVRSL